jgi:hypothetical protein
MMQHNNSTPPRRAVPTVTRLVKGVPCQLTLQWREIRLTQPGGIEGYALVLGIIANHLERHVHERFGLTPAGLSDRGSRGKAWRSRGHRIRTSIIGEAG